MRTLPNQSDEFLHINFEARIKQFRVNGRGRSASLSLAGEWTICDLGLGENLVEDETCKVINLGGFSNKEIEDLAKTLDDEHVRQRMNAHIGLKRGTTTTTGHLRPARRIQRAFA